MNYLTLSDLLELHDSVIETSGGLRGVRDIGILESILIHIQNDEYYPDFADKLTHLVYAVNKSHAFNDGNKRTSIMAGVYFLLLNGWEAQRVAHFAVSMEDMAVDVAANIIDKQTLSLMIMLVLSMVEK